MTTPDRVLAALVMTICGLAILFGLAAVFIPSFDTSKAVLIGTVLGALAPLAATLAGITWAKSIDKKRNGSDSSAGGSE